MKVPTTNGEVPDGKPREEYSYLVVVLGPLALDDGVERRQHPGVRADAVVVAESVRVRDAFS